MTTILRHRYILGVFALLTFLWACDQKQEFDQYIHLGNDVWEYYDAKTFRVEIKNHELPRNVYLKVRNDHNYPYSNLYIISEIKQPNRFSVKDTLEFEMADSYGKLLGKGLTDVKESQLFILENYKFPENGKYVFKFKHAMRKRGSVKPLKELRGVIDVGLRIEKAN